MKFFEKGLTQRRIKPVVYNAEVKKEFLPQTTQTPQTCYSKYLFLILAVIVLFFSCQDEPEDTTKTVNALQPSISVQPADVFWNVFSTTTIDLSVTSNVTDGGDLTYQWYSNTNNSASGGTPITTGGTNAALSLNKSNYTTNGSRYFYVVVTNTNNNADRTKTATVTSAIAEVVVVGNSDTAYTTSAIPANLKGTWSYDWGGGYVEKYVIDETTFTSEYTYTGTIAGHRSNSGGDGYITIKFTENFNYIDSENMFYVIHYQTLTDSALSLSGAWLGADPDFEFGVGSGGKATQAEAEAVMTVSAGYFGMYSSLSKEDADNSETSYTTTKKYTSNSGDTSAVGKYDEGEASIEDAEAEYINSNGSYKFEKDLITFEKI